MRSRIICAAFAVAALASLPSTALAASGSGSQSVSGLVLDTISVVPAPVTLTGMTPGSGTPASGSGNVVVTSTTCYNLAVADATNDGYLQGAANGGAFTSRLTWRTGSAAFADLTSSSATVASSQSTTLGRTHALDYRQPLAGQNVSADNYSTSATFTATSCV